MSYYSNIELITILCFYKISKESVEEFTKQFNNYFRKDVSPQTIMYSVTLFKNIDPSNNLRNYNEDGQYKSIWNEYITNNKIDILKNLYTIFKKGTYIETVDIYEERYNNYNQYDIKIPDFIDKPQPIPLIYDNNDKNIISRRREVVTNALCLAEYKCEGNCDTKLFMNKKGISYYTEGHHLIPLCYQNVFDYSLDVEANVVSLCPVCHSLLHYGKEPEQLIKQLYEKRKRRLEKCMLKINYEELLLLYR